MPGDLHAPDAASPDAPARSPRRPLEVPVAGDDPEFLGDRIRKRVRQELGISAMDLLPALAVRNEDVTVSAGRDIAGVGVAAAHLAHEAVSECCVAGAPERDRGNVVEAHAVLNAGSTGDEALTKAFQDHIKAMIAPCKHPRSIRFRDDLPKTPPGEDQRFKLKDMQVLRK